jgi:hypothetical protein
MKSIAIIQSNYIPWKGYLDIINSVDEFVLHDECQYTKRDWRNRNRIKTHQGLKWLAIPVCTKGKRFTAVCEIKTDGSCWIDKHLLTLQHQYAKAPNFKEIYPEIERLYSSCRDVTLLTEINTILLRGICSLLDISTPLLFSMDLGEDMNDPTDRLIDICLRREADTYLSGPSAKAYLDENRFAAKGIEVVWASYDHYPAYQQLHPPFEHAVTVLDTLFHLGAEKAREHTCLFQINDNSLSLQKACC